MSLTAEQLAIRKHGLGSSEIAAVCGVNPFRKPIDVFLEKTGRAEPFEETPQTKLGQRLERQIAEIYAEERGCDLTPGATVIGREPWMIATPDFLVGPVAERRVLECKNVGYRVAHHWPEGEMPEYVRIQNLWQQEVVGVHAGDVAALIGGRDFRIVDSPYDKDIVESLVEIGGAFWHDHVLKDIAPAVDGSDSWAAYIKARWPSDMTPPIEAGPDADEFARRLGIARAEMKWAEEERAEVENELKVLIGEAAGMRSELGWSISWRHSKSGGTDWKGVVESIRKCLIIAGPETVNLEARIRDYERPGPRIFRFTPPKDAK